MHPEDFITSYENALATQQWGEVALLIHPDCVVTFSDGSCHRGKKAVQDAFQKNFDAIKDEEYAISDLHWIVKSSNFAVCAYSFRWSGVVAGEQASGAGRGTSTIVRKEDSWQLIAEHLGPKA